MTELRKSPNYITTRQHGRVDPVFVTVPLFGRASTTDGRRNYHTAQSLLWSGAATAELVVVVVLGSPKNDHQKPRIVCPSRGFYSTLSLLLIIHYHLQLLFFSLSFNSQPTILPTPPRRYSRNQEPRVIILLEAKLLHEKDPPRSSYLLARLPPPSHGPWLLYLSVLLGCWGLWSYAVCGGVGFGTGELIACCFLKWIFLHSS